MFTRSLTIAFAIVTFSVGAAAAQNQGRLAPPDAAADRLVAEALRQTPEIQIAQANAEAARRRIVPARTLPDPSASSTYQNEGRAFSLGRAEGTFLGLMLSQPLPWPGKLSLAGKTAESEAREIATSDVGRAERTVVARVRNAWYDLLLARAVDRVIEERRATATQIEATARERYAAGLAVQQDALRAQVELARIDELKATQRAVIAARTAELNRLIGRAQDTPVESAADLPAPATLPADSDVIAAAINRSPEVVAARQGIETGRLVVQIVRRNFFPDFVVSAGSMYRRGFEMGPMWQVGVGISIPAWIDRRQANQLAEAQARLDARTAQADLVPRELELRTRERIAQTNASDQIAALYREKVLPLDQLSLESALASYTSGKVPFITVLDALNALFSDRVVYAGRLAESAKWRVAIDEASLASTAMTGTPSMSSGASMATGPSAPASGPARSSASSSMTSMRQ